MRNQPVVLTIVYFEDGNSENIAAVLAQATADLSTLKTKLIIENNNFSRARGFRKALINMNATKENSIVWLCDVDMYFTRDFIDRCRTTPILNQQAG